jgi:hypothetical protein
MAANSFAQIELLGKYSAGFIGGESIDFVGTDSFYLNGFYCTHGVRGKGRCEIRDNMLYLYFEKTAPKIEAPRPPVIEMTDNKDNIAGINITCVDENEKPLDGAVIYLRKRNGTVDTILTGTAGKAFCRINNADLPVQLESLYVGFEKIKLTLERPAAYNILISHKSISVFKELHKGEVWTYEIDDLSEDLIVMRPARSTERFRHYKREKTNQHTR